MAREHRVIPLIVAVAVQLRNACCEPATVVTGTWRYGCEEACAAGRAPCCMSKVCVSAIGVRFCSGDVILRHHDIVTPSLTSTCSLRKRNPSGSNVSTRTVSACVLHYMISWIVRPVLRYQLVPENTFEPPAALHGQESDPSICSQQAIFKAEQACILRRHEPFEIPPARRNQRRLVPPSCTGP